MAAFLALGIALAAGGTALADEDREAIDSISLSFDSEITTGSSSCEVDVDTEDDEYSVGGVEVLNASGVWAGGARPKLEIYLYADEDYYFSSAKESMFHFYGEDVEFVSAKRQEDNSELVLVVKLDALDEEDLDIDDVSWDTSSGTARWERVPDAMGYEVRLYRGSTLVGTETIRSSSDTSYNFSGLMKQSGSYYFKVRAVGSGSAKGEWTTSGKLRVSSSGELGASEYDEDDEDDKEYNPSNTSSTPQEGDYSDEDFYDDDDDDDWDDDDDDDDDWDDDDDDDDDSDDGPGSSSSSSSSSSSKSSSSKSRSKASDEDGISVYERAVTTGSRDIWQQDQYGWWLQMEDDTYPTNAWVLVDGQWYCFNESGYLRYGWILSDGKWYYCESSGAMLVNARTPDGNYVGGDGAWIE